MVLAAPHHEAATQAHDAFFDVDHPGFAPCFVQPVPRPAKVEVLDVGTQEPARPPPGAPAERVSGRGHDGARIEPPAQAPHRTARYVEVEAGHPATWPQDTGELDQGRRRIR